MALIHRSWSDVAQRYHRQRILISSPESLRSVIQSTTGGPRVSKLSSQCDLAFIYPKIAINEISWLLTRSDSHRSGSVRVPYTPSIDASHDITGQLAGLGHLHQLRGLKPGPIRMHNVTWTVYYMVVPTFAVFVKCGRKLTCGVLTAFLARAKTRNLLSRTVLRLCCS